MKPSVTAVLSALSGLITREVSPALGDTYLSEQVQRAAALLGAAGEEFDRAAARRVQENQAMRRLFGRAVGLVAGLDPTLAGALTDAAQGSDLDDLRVSRLDAENQRLRTLLIALHAWAETEPAPSPQVRELLTDIWAELRASTERRTLSMGRA
jgi:hypothetical protein